ncbi:MAG: biotin transporter BioY [Selenomonadaceae bacterium]|nr:biotin transporter BioY [Selenomonadaceae bacterium]MBQ7493402.1 biotin transporter BioY [Selenomonadaceae bacterium]
MVLNLSVRELVLAGLFVALITVGTFIRIPIGADFYTLQFLFTLLAGLVLGERLGALAVGAYVLLGLLGVPVFAAVGGIGYLFKPTFGYLVGFIVQAWFCGRFSRMLAVANFKNILAVNLIGMLIVYAIGMSWLYIVSNYVIDAPLTLWVLFIDSFVLQVVPDGVLCVMAAILALRLKKAGFWL